MPHVRQCDQYRDQYGVRALICCGNNIFRQCQPFSSLFSAPLSTPGQQRADPTTPSPRLPYQLGTASGKCWWKTDSGRRGSVSIEVAPPPWFRSFSCPHSSSCRDGSSSQPLLISGLPHPPLLAFWFFSYLYNEFPIPGMSYVP